MGTYTLLCLIAILQIWGEPPALADEESVLKDLAKQHPGWSLYGHFFGPSNIRLSEIHLPEESTQPGQSTTVDFGFPYRKFQTKTEPGPEYLRSCGVGDFW